MKDDHDLIHKAIGWMLREVGKRISKEKLENFLIKNISGMPRVSLRYALEHFSQKDRQYFLKK
jgi:3-methyladenine DNA glycosylase AlkD